MKSSAKRHRTRRHTRVSENSRVPSLRHHKASGQGYVVLNGKAVYLCKHGELYADSFYAQLLRIPKPGGRLLHYTGAPGSRGRRIDLGASVSRRLARLGFAKVHIDSETGCILATRRAGGASFLAPPAATRLRGARRWHW